MVRIGTICRTSKDYERETVNEIQKFHKNLNRNLHPMQNEVEYQRALNAIKMEKIFAKPFLASLEGHSDGVYSMAKSPVSMSNFLSGSFNGEVILWDLGKKEVQLNIHAHENYVKGLTFSKTGKVFVSCGDDQTIKIWRTPKEKHRTDLGAQAVTNNYSDVEPLNTYLSSSLLNGIDHSRLEPMFLTSGTHVQVWNYERSSPILSFDWTTDPAIKAVFNPADPNLFASTANDRSIAVYDLRTQTPVHKVLMDMRSNSLCWNPMEPFNFTVANEDTKCYTFDMRKLEIARMVHKDHLGAVLDIDYSPTGKEFVTGSYDKTLRIFPVDSGRSRDVYHTRRMQKIFAVKFSQDGRFLMSGSDETNVRLWKAKASERLGTQTSREKQAQAYNEALKKKFQYNKEIARINRHRHLPKVLLNKKKKRQIMKQSEFRKEQNRRAHTKPGSVQYQSERKRKIYKTVE
eukprot:CAMPEP_0115045314 /NCGR_PEP_ID=MMETSP0216-20121206/48074_1 /TAXON_ID=223996 /ORGANISM="Protocruzia adherens, Strain Boccale" /LENGTH=458 /DNA_ID=CAMNT_0002428169 /DNA_START=109 /DNA_END=1485 /DNA_ORIENTATION=+